MTTVLDLQRRLSSFGCNPGPQDGLLGPSTLGAIGQISRPDWNALPLVQSAPDVIPSSWVPAQQAGYLTPWAGAYSELLWWRQIPADVTATYAWRS